MPIQNEYYITLLKAIAGWFLGDRDKARFMVLFLLLLANSGMNFVDAQTLKHYGEKLDNHSSQLHELNDKFEVIMVAMTTQKERDSEQDKRLKELESSGKKQNEQLNEHDKRINEHDKRISNLEGEQGGKKEKQGVNKNDKGKN